MFALCVRALRQFAQIPVYRQAEPNGTSYVLVSTSRIAGNPEHRIATLQQTVGDRVLIGPEDRIACALAAGGMDDGVAGLLRVASSEPLRVRHRLDAHSSVLVVATEAVLAPLASRPEGRAGSEARATPWRGIRFYW
jgi:hypothetical protein